MSDFQSRFKDRFVVVGRNGELEPVQNQSSSNLNGRGTRLNAQPNTRNGVSSGVSSGPSTTFSYATTSTISTGSTPASQVPHEKPQPQVSSDRSEPNISSDIFNPIPATNLLAKASDLVDDPEFQSDTPERIPSSPQHQDARSINPIYEHSHSAYTPSSQVQDEADVSFSESQDAQSLRATFMAPVTPNYTAYSLPLNDTMEMSSQTSSSSKQRGPIVTPRHPVVDPIFRPANQNSEDDLQVADANRLRDLLQSASSIKPPPSPSQSNSHPQHPGSASHRSNSPARLPESNHSSYSGIPLPSSTHGNATPVHHRVGSHSDAYGGSPNGPGIAPTPNALAEHYSRLQTSAHAEHRPGNSKRMNLKSGGSAGSSLLIPRQQARGPGFGGGIDGVARKSKPNSYVSIMNYSEKGQWQSPEEIAFEKERQRRAALRASRRESTRTRRMRIQFVQRRIAASTGFFLAVPRGYVTPSEPTQDAERKSSNDSSLSQSSNCVFSAKELVSSMLSERVVDLIQAMRVGGIRVRDSSIFIFNLPFPFPKSISRALKELVPLGSSPTPTPQSANPQALNTPGEGLTLIAYVAAYLRILDDLKILPTMALRAAIQAAQAAEAVQAHADQCAVSEDCQPDYDEAKDGKLSPAEEAEMQLDIEADDELCTAPPGCNSIQGVIPEELEAILRNNSLPEVRALWHALPDPPNGLALAEQYYLYMRQVLATTFAGVENDQPEHIDMNVGYDVEDVDDAAWRHVVPEKLPRQTDYFAGVRKSKQLPAVLYQNYVMYQHKRAVEVAQLAASQIHVMPSAASSSSSSSSSSASAFSSRQAASGIGARQAPRGSVQVSGTSAKSGPTVTPGLVSEPEVPPEVAAALAALGVNPADDQNQVASSSSAVPSTQSSFGPTSKPKSGVSRGYGSVTASRHGITTSERIKAARNRREQREREQEDHQLREHAPIGFPMAREREAGYKPYTLKDWQARPVIAPPPRLGPDLQREEIVAAKGRRAKMIEIASKIKSRNDGLLAVYRAEDATDLSRLPNSRDPDFLESVSPRLAELERQRLQGGRVGHSRGPSANGLSDDHSDDASLEGDASSSSRMHANTHHDEPDMDFDDLVAAASEFTGTQIEPRNEASKGSGVGAERRASRSLLSSGPSTPSSRIPPTGNPSTVNAIRSTAKPVHVVEQGRRKGSTPIKPTAITALARSSLPQAVAHPSSHPGSSENMRRSSGDGMLGGNAETSLGQPSKTKPGSGIKAEAGSALRVQEDALDTLVRATPASGPSPTAAKSNLEELALAQNMARQRAAEVRKALRRK